MKKGNTKILHQIKGISPFILAFLPILSLKMVSIAIITFVLTSVFFSHHDNSRNEIKNSYKLILLVAIPFLFSVLALLWTSNYYQELKIIEKNLSFIILPIVFLYFKPIYTLKQRTTFIKIYIISVIILNICTFIYLFVYKGINVDADYNYLRSIQLRESIEQVPVIGEHAIYFSLMTGLALILLMYNNFKYKAIKIFFIIVLTSGVIIASSRGVLIALFAVSILVIFQKFKNRTTATLYLILFIVTCSSLTLIPTINQRIFEVFQTSYTFPNGSNYNSFNLRLGIYNCSYSIIKEAPIYGYSPANVQEKLNSCYENYNTDAYRLNEYNTHNQYFDYLASYGFIGLSLIISSFVLFYRKSLKYHDNSYLNFLVLFYICFLTENLLVRNTGIVLFVTFNCLFLCQNFKKEKNDNSQC